MMPPDQMARGKVDPLRTDLSCVGFPGHEALSRVDVPSANMPATGGAEQQGVWVVAKSRHLHIPNLCWHFRPLHLQRQNGAISLTDVWSYFLHDSTFRQ